ncbi:MAG: antibiotic biosynthesis monooxygenase [Sphingobacteriales bacterium]|nr:MAG: antibiotic biosynthesis monooxygenase [Sphingobacteriales bacterium]
MYLLQGKLLAKAGAKDQLAAILLQAAALMAQATGCKLYAVATDTEDSDAVHITEIWASQSDHDASLNVAGVRELIQQAMPLLASPPQKGQEYHILGGWGV